MTLRVVNNLTRVVTAGPWVGDPSVLGEPTYIFQQCSIWVLNDDLVLDARDDDL